LDHPAGGMAQNGEMGVVHGPYDPC
jgi:hypothetical protein